MLESKCGFPPRFVVTYNRIVSDAQLNSKIIMSTGESELDMTFQVSDHSDPIRGMTAKIYCTYM